MILNNDYNYNIISKTDYDMKYLLAKLEGTIHKYILIFYEDDKNQIQIKCLYSINQIPNNVIVKYYIEEIDSSDFELEYSYSKYYHILNVGYFHEFEYEFVLNNKNKIDYSVISQQMENYNQEWKKFEVNDYVFLQNTN